MTREHRIGDKDSVAGIVDLVTRLATLLESEFSDGVTRFDLSHKGDFDTLTALRSQPPPHRMSPTQLAAAALLTSGGMTSRLDRLESAGLVRRLDDPDDRRALLVELTTKGVEVVEAVAQSALEWQTQLFEPISQRERQVLRSALGKLVEGLGDAAG